MFSYEFCEGSKNTLFTARSAIDFITENEESKIAYDYVMMLLCNNKLEHIAWCIFEHTTWEKF